jgi:CBS domain-containing protein
MSIYLSQLLDRPVWDGQGQQLGRCQDLLVAEARNDFAVLRALVLKRGRNEQVLVSAEDVLWLHPSTILRSATPAIYHLVGDEFWLRDQVLDQQIVDLEGRRMVRANDLQFVRSESDQRYYLVGVGTGTRSLLRRLGLEGVSSKLSGLMGRKIGEQVIPWQEVASVAADAPIRLRVSQSKISQMNPVDLAQMISDMDRPSGQTLLETLDNETVADALQEASPELQTSILAAMTPERAADILEEMDPDDAADLLADVPEDDRANLLSLMEDEEASDVQKLLAFPEDSAGGLMTTEYATIPVGLSVGEAIDYLRQSAEAQQDEALYTVHVVDGQGHLLGVVALRHLVMAAPREQVTEIMDTHPVTVEPLTSQREVARLVARYNLLAVPVIDEAGILHGIVTVDDAIDAIIPTVWKKQLPRFF